MKLLFIFALAALFGSCRSADSHFKKAVDKGLEIDSVWKPKYVPLKIAPISVKMDFKNPDTVKVVELCKEVVKQKKKNVKPLQQAICPKIDTTYSIPVSYGDSVAFMAFRIRAEGGTVRVDHPKFEMLVVSREGTTTIKTGITRGRAALLVITSAVLGFLIGAVLVLIRNRKAP